MKTLFLYSFLVISQSAFCQSNFTLDYKLVGLGSNRYKVFYPIIHIEGNQMTYITEKRKFKVPIRQSSVDSIANVVNVIKDTTIFRTNPCIMSGTVSYLAIRTSEKKLHFTLDNTSDVAALKIFSILNTYLPDKHKLEASDRLIQRQAECIESLWKLFSDSTTY